MTSPINPTTMANLQAGVAMASALSALFPPNVQKAIAIAAAAAGAVNTWVQSGQEGDVTDAQLQALFDQFSVNKADDLAAQAEAQAITPKDPQP